MTTPKKHHFVPQMLLRRFVGDGGKPVIKLTPPGETRLGQQGVEVWLPIASDVAVCAILRQSTLIAGRSEALIRSLVHAR